MPARISLKNSLFMFLGGLVCAIGTAFLVNFIFSGPKLGSHYDFLLKFRQQAPVSREILIIKTDDFIEGGDLFTVLMALTEMEAANLIQTGRVPPSSSPVTLTEAEIRRRFIEEYVLIGSNIQKLFEGIRMGSVSPVEAPSFVRRLVELTEHGRDRLLAALIDRDENMIRAAAVFGGYLEVETPPLFDNDGRIRRVKPVDKETSLEHPVYTGLKKRFAVSQIETSGTAEILWIRKSDGSEVDIQLDRNGNIITPWNCDFRVIDIEVFHEYGKADIAMREALEAADELGAFSQYPADVSPIFLGEYALILQGELLQSPGTESRLDWVAARANYFKSLDNFLSGSTEALLINEYDRLISRESNSRELGVLYGMRDELIQAFALMREKHKELSALRAGLEEELVLSFCVMGPEHNAQYSALLANALITGSHVNPIRDRYALFWSITAAFFVLTIIFLLRPLLLLAIGAFLSFFAAALFGALFFILNSYWIDPLIVFSSSLAGTIVIFSCKSVFLNYRARSFRTAYGASVSPDLLQNLIEDGRPLLSEINVASAVVIAIKNIGLLSAENREKAQNAGLAKKAFFASAKKIIFDSGAVVAGFEGDTILACFGSPLSGTVNHVTKACSLVREMISKEKTWRFGIDAGECTFLWSPEAGFCVNGKTAVRAKVLASRTSRYRVRALITNSVREKISFDGNMIDNLFGEQDPVFEFPS